MTRITTESTYEVFDDDEGVSICVGSDQDGFGIVRISTNDDKSKEWFGEIDFTLSPEIAEAVAKAILRKVKDIKDNA